MSKLSVLKSFNAAVHIVNAGHTVKRSVTSAALGTSHFVRDVTLGSATSMRDAATAFVAGAKYASRVNKNQQRGAATAKINELTRTEV